MASRGSTMHHNIYSLISKLNDPDPDIRFMQLNDLASILNTSNAPFQSEPATINKAVDALVVAIHDGNGEVQNQALKCVGPLAAKVPREVYPNYIRKVADLLNNTEIDPSIPSAALRIIVGSLPRPASAANDLDIKDAYNAVSQELITRLLGRNLKSNAKLSGNAAGLLQQQKNKAYNADAVDVVIELLRCYGVMLNEVEIYALGEALLHLIEASAANGVVKKRALVGIAGVVPYYKPPQLHALVQSVHQQLLNPKISISHRRYLISTIGTLTRAIPTRAGPYMKLLAPQVLATLSQDDLGMNRGDLDDDMEVDPELEELREATLVTLENMIMSCQSEMQAHLDEAIASAARYIKYDPNVVAGEDDEEMDGTQDTGSDGGVTEEPTDEDDEYADFDDEDAFDDIEDVSWKVRRCAAKVFYTVVTDTSATEQDRLFDKLTPLLISRLNAEREDSVRLEIIATLTALIRKAASASKQATGGRNGTNGPLAASHKRKREDSNLSIADFDLRGLVHSRLTPPYVPPSPPLGPQADLATVIPKIVQSTLRLWKKASISLKQSLVSMVKAIAVSRNGALADHLQQLEDPLADAVKSSTGFAISNASGSTATASSLQIESLSLVSSLAQTNSGSVLMPFVVALIPSVTSLVGSRNYRVATEALNTIEQFSKALTPPRLMSSNKDNSTHLEKLYAIISKPITDNNADLEVRHKAIHAFGVLVSRSSGTGLLQQAARTTALGIIDDRLRNETTRLEAARAVGMIAEAASPKDNLGSQWVQEVSIELANQLRKSDRALKAVCLESLQYMALNKTTASQYSSDTIQQIADQLVPVIRPDDLNLLTPALVILAKFIPINPKALTDQSVIQAICMLAQVKLEGPPLKAYLLVIKVIGQAGQGQTLMTGLLAVGTNGDTHVLGRAIGTLMVFGGSETGQSLDSFVKEVKNNDESSACLALTVLGEVGLRTGSQQLPFDLNIFADRLTAQSDKVRLSAAVALGSASSSNVQAYLPAILQGMQAGGKQQYLYLHALKGILQHAENSSTSIQPFLSSVWSTLFATSTAEDSAVVGAECIGRVVLLDPTTYLSALDQALDSPQSSIRNTIITAFRFTLSDHDQHYTLALSHIIITLLNRMLSDPDLANRRLAMTTLSAAIQHRQSLILPDLPQLLPIVLSDTYKKAELIKKVKIGPFTHEEDSGIDLRKAAYSALYSLVELPAAHPYLSVPDIFSRVVEGMSDDHDVRTLSCLMLSRLSEIDPETTKSKLPALAEQYRKVLETKPKENAVKQEIEVINQANSVVIRSSVEMMKKFPNASGGSGESEMMPWRQYVEYMSKDFAMLKKQVELES